MGRRTTSILVTLSILVLAVVVSVPLSRAQIVKISNSVLLLPQKVLSLSPKVLRGALLRSPSIAAIKEAENNGVIVGASYHNDTSPPLRDMKPVPFKERPEHEANKNPKIPIHHTDAADGAFVQNQHVPSPNVPAPILNFDGIPFPGVVCNCAPPDTNGEVGLTQYTQIVNEGFQVFNKTTGASVFGPVAISTVWTGFGGPCELAGDGDPVVLYDQLADRWVVSQFADNGITVTDECIAVSTTSDASGPYNRYGFHLSENFNDYPKLAVWPDGYYMSVNVFNSAGTAFLGPQPFAFDRTAMLAGAPATFVSTGVTGGPTEDAYLPCDLDGSSLPPAGAPNCFVEFPGTLPVYKVYHMHADFAVPANTTFTLFASPPAAPFTFLCPVTRSCVPQLGSTAGLDAIADRFMFRMAYRNFGDHESVVGNYTVSSNGVAGIRWIELRDVTAGPVTLFQESTYQPDTTWRWMGSVAMDVQGNMMLGFSASDATINPQIRYAGRLASDPINVLAQGEGHLFDGTGSQLDTVNRWGDYSDITVDPVDDCTFWYTQEYYATTSSFNWRTRIGNFKFPGCAIGTPTPTITGTRTETPTPTNTFTPTNTPTPTPTPCPGDQYTISPGIVTPVPGVTDIGNHCDDCDTLVALPFSFTLYNQTFNNVNVSSNGRLDFVTANEPGGFVTSCLPAPPNIGPYDFTIFPLWHDLRTDTGLSGCATFASGCGIFTSVSGVAPDRIFNIEWRAVRFANNAQAEDFEVRLYEASPVKQFDVIYAALNGITTSDTAGVQGNAAAGFFTQDFCNTLAPSNVSRTYQSTGCQTPTPTITGTRTETPTPTPTCTPVVLNGSIDNSDPTQVDRLFRSGVPGSCGTTLACATFGDGLPHHYDDYTFTNTTGSAQCVTVDVNTACTGTNFVFTAAYLGSFDPNNICTNWIADEGGSPNPTQPFSFDIANGQTFVLVVSEVTSGAGCPAYTLSVSGLCGGATPTPTPTPTPTITGTLTVTPTPTPTACVTSWQIEANMPIDLYGAAGASDGTFVYEAGGYSFSLATTLNVFNRYDPATNTWSPLAPMPGAAIMASAVYYPTTNKIFVFGGEDAASGVNSNATRIYDIATNTWSAGANMPDVRSFMASGYNSADGKIYLASGYNTGDVTSAQPNTWAYDPVANTFNTALAAMPHPTGGAASGIINGHLYVAGGRDATNTVIALTWDYNIGANTWTAKANMPIATNVPGNAVAAGELWVFGSGNPFGPIGPSDHQRGPNTAATGLVYDPVADAWSNAPNLNVARSFVSGTSTGTKLVAAGGYNGATTVATTEVRALSCVTPTNTPTNTPVPPTNTPTNTPTFTPTNTPTPTPVIGNQGCGTGYWKQQQHFDSWCASYTTTTLVSTVFDTTDCGCNFSSLTFLQALQGAGFGNSLCDAQAKLLQQGVAALLNACPGSGVAYPLSTAQVISEVNTALQSCNRTTILSEATRLSGFNNGPGGCPLH